MAEKTHKDATIRDVAREAGVSTMSVTRAFRKNALITEETRKRVIEAAEKLNFIPNFNARGLRGSPSMSIGILMTNPFGSDIVRPLSLSLMKAKYVAFIADSLSDIQIVKEGLSDFCSRRVCGVILQWREHYRKDLRLMELLKHLHNVVLYTNEACEGIPYDACELDYIPAYKEAVEQLWKDGRRNIIYLGRNDQPHKHACFEALNKHRLNTVEAHVDTSVYPSKPACANYYDALQDRLLTGNIPDAVLTANDIAAAQACACLKAHGLSVPADTAVIGAGNAQMSAFCSPSIASIDWNSYKVAEKIYEMLINRINKPKSALRYEKVDCSYILRESAMTERNMKTGEGIYSYEKTN